MEPEQTPTPDGDPAAGAGGLPDTPDGTAADPLGHAASPVTTVLDAVSAQVRALQTTPTLTLSDDELRTAVIAAHRLANQVEAATLHLVRALDDRPEAMPTCPAGKVAATFLVHALRLDPGTAARDVAAARPPRPGRRRRRCRHRRHRPGWWPGCHGDGVARGGCRVGGRGHLPPPRRPRHRLRGPHRR
ncbi:MAG: hypothetical protein U0Q19_10595 [Kineosporiaceae bacterium]